MGDTSCKLRSGGRVLQLCQGETANAVGWQNSHRRQFHSNHVMCPLPEVIINSFSLVQCQKVGLGWVTELFNFAMAVAWRREGNAGNCSPYFYLFLHVS